jgi:hypothetical protein
MIKFLSVLAFVFTVTSQAQIIFPPGNGGGGGGGAVDDFNGRTGSVIPAASDYDAVQIDNTPAGNVAAIDLQAAINELDTEKEPAISATTVADYLRGDKAFANFDSAARAALLTGYVSGAGTVAATDSILQALQKLNGNQIASIVQTITNGATTTAPSEDAVFDALALKEDLANKNANNGYAGLDAGGKIPSSLLPNTVMEYQGNWNATTNTPALADGTGNAGDVYRANVAGSTNFGSGAIAFNIGDWAVYNGAIWEYAANSNLVMSVNGQQGVVVLDTDDIAEGTALYFTEARVRSTPLTGFTSGAGTVAATDTVLQAFQKLDGNIASATSGTANTMAGFDGTGVLYTIPGFGISTVTGGASVDRTYVPVNAGGYTKIHRFESEIDTQSNTTGDTVNGAFFDLHAGRLTSGFGVGDGFNALYSAFSIDNDGDYGQVNNFVSGGNFGDGVGGSATSIQTINAFDNIDAGFHVDDYRPVVIGVNNLGDVDDEQIIQINNNGDVNNGSTGIQFSKTGDVGFITGFRMDYNGTAGGGYGMSQVLQGDFTGQFEHINLSNSANVAGNYFLVNSNMSGDITGVGGYFGLNMSMSGDSENISPVNAYNSGDTTYINAVSFSNDGDVTNGYTGLNMNNTGSTQYMSAVNYVNTGVQTNSSQIITVQDNPTAATSTTGVNVNMQGTYSTSVQGLNVSVDSATSPDIISINANGGRANINSEVSSADAIPPASFAMNYIGGQLTIANGFPLAGEFGFGNNLATTSLFYDDMPADFTTLGLGYTHVGFVGQVLVDAGVTVADMNMALGGAGVPAGSSGDITNATMFRAMGFLNQGGTVDVTNMRGFATGSPLCAMATDCWGFFDGSNAENYLSKLAIGTVSNKVGAGLELDVNGQASFQDISSIKSVAYSWPAAQGAALEVLQNDGAGNLDWVAIPSAPVTSVFGRTGVVAAATSDYDANQVDNTPAGNIAATDVQAAINELDTEKANLTDLVSIVSINSNTTGSGVSKTYFADTSGGAFTFTLPLAASFSGVKFIVKNIDFGGANDVSVARSGANLIEGGTTDTLTPGETRSYQSDGTNWFVLE